VTTDTGSVSDPSTANIAGRRVTRGRKVLRIVAWVLSSLLFAAGLVNWVQMATFPASLAAHPVTTVATVTDTYINGFGGDPAADYRYTVGGRTYSGSGEDSLNGADLESSVGSHLNIEYARDAPWESCMCHATNAGLQPLEVAMSTIALLPLPVVIVLTARRRHKLTTP
jgi:hypothetical protein